MSTQASIRRWHPVAALNEIPLHEGRKVQWNGLEVALFNLGDEYLAVDNQCPHRQGPLADGLVAGKAVFCPLHNWKIDLKKGCVLSGPLEQAAAGIKTYPVKVIHGHVYIAFEEGSLQEGACGA